MDSAFMINLTNMQLQSLLVKHKQHYSQMVLTYSIIDYHIILKCY